MTKQKLLADALADIAQDILSAKLPTVAESTKISVRYFGHGNRFEARARNNGEFSLTLFIHEDQDSGEFKEIISDAIGVLQRLAAERVSIRKSTLVKLVNNHPTTKEEKAEIIRLLTD